MIKSVLNITIDDPLNELISGLEEWCLAFNEFAIIFFGYMKYIMVFILLAIGISTLLKLRGNFLQERLKNIDKEITEINKFRNPRLILGTIYIVIAFGILLNWFTILTAIVRSQYLYPGIHMLVL